MLKHIVGLLVTGLLSASITLAADTPDAKTNAAGAPVKKNAGFAGKVLVVDKQAGMLTVGSLNSKRSQQKGSVICVDSETKITKGEAPATVDDIKVGDRINYGIRRATDVTTYKASFIRISETPAEPEKKK